MILDKINSPQDVKELDKADLIRLGVEIREFLLQSISKTGGHLASNLGVVELTIALHRVFNSPEDKIVWDVGHQAYVHKLLTGRKDGFENLRNYGGMSGFPKRCESTHDCFETGHSSTSISAAVGMAKARDLMGKDNSVIAVIGDGALTGGMAFEAMNHAGHSDLDLTVILNDNEMSISQNTGALSKQLRKLRMTPAYSNIKGETRSALSSIPHVGKPLTKSITKFKAGLKVMLVNGMLFEGLGYHYYGPIDGHNLDELTNALEMSKSVEGPKLIHVITKKGRGYLPAEKHPENYHGVGAFDLKTGVKPGGKNTFSAIFGKTMVRLAGENENVVAISAAMPDGTGLGTFKETYPKRFIDVGIAEQHAVTMAAGMATQGVKPVFAVYSTFLQRGYDQILHDVCLQNLPVVFAIDRAGLVGKDGETHHGVFDLSYLTHMPNMTVLAPKDGPELERMLEYAVCEHDGPIAIRYPRGNAYEIERRLESASVGQQESCLAPEHLVSGQDVLLFAVGNMAQTALEAAEYLEKNNISTEVVNVKCVFPLQEDALLKIVEKHPSHLVVTLEDNVIEGGFGNRLAAWLGTKGIRKDVQCLGIPSKFVEHGAVDDLRRTLGLDPNGIAKRVQMKLKIRRRP